MLANSFDPVPSRNIVEVDWLRPRWSPPVRPRGLEAVLALLVGWRSADLLRIADPIKSRKERLFSMSKGAVLRPPFSSPSSIEP